MKTKMLLVLAFLLISLPVFAAEKLSVSECAQDQTRTTMFTQMAGANITVGPGEIVSILFSGNFSAYNNSSARRYIGGTVRLMRDGVIVDEAQMFASALAQNPIVQPLYLHAFEVPHIGSHQYSIHWNTVESDKTWFSVNCRSLTAIIQ